MLENLAVGDGNVDECEAVSVESRSQARRQRAVNAGVGQPYEVESGINCCSLGDETKPS